MRGAPSACVYTRGGGGGIKGGNKNFNWYADLHNWREP